MVMEEGATEVQRPLLKASQRLLAVKKKLVAQPPPLQRCNEVTSTIPVAAAAHNSSGAAAPSADSTATAPNAADCSATVSISGMAIGSVAEVSLPRRTAGDNTVAAAYAASLGGAAGEATERTAPALGLTTHAAADGAAQSILDASTRRFPAGDDSQIADRPTNGDVAGAGAAAVTAVPLLTDTGAASAGQLAGCADGAQAASSGLGTGAQVATAAIGAAQGGELPAGQTGHKDVAAVAAAEAEGGLRNGEEGGPPVRAAAVARGPAHDDSGQANTTSVPRGGSDAAGNIRAFSARIKILASMLKANTLFITSVLAKKCGFSSPDDMLPRGGFSIYSGQLRFDNCSLRKVRCSAIKSGSTTKHDGLEWVAGVSCLRDSWLKDAGFKLNDVLRFQLKDGVYTLERLETAQPSGSAAPAAADAAPSAAAAEPAAPAALGYERNNSSCGATGETHGLAAAARPASGAAYLEGSGAFLTQVGSCEPGGVAVAQERESGETAGAVSAADSGGLNDSRRGAGTSAILNDATRAVSSVYVDDLQADVAAETGGMEGSMAGPSGTATNVPSMQPGRSQAIVEAAPLPGSASNLTTSSAEPSMTAAATGAGDPVLPAADEMIIPGKVTAPKNPKRPSPTKATSAQTKPLGQDTVPAKKTAKKTAGSSAGVPVAKAPVSSAAAAAAAPVAVGPPAKRPRLSRSQEGVTLTQPSQKTLPRHEAPQPVPCSRLEASAAVDLPQGAEEDKAGGVKDAAGIGRIGRFFTDCAKTLTATDVGRHFIIPTTMLSKGGIFAKLHEQMAFVKHTIRFIDAADPSKSWTAMPSWPNNKPRMGLVAAFRALGAKPNDMVVFGKPTGPYPGDTDGIPTFTFHIKRTNPISLEDELPAGDATTATVPTSTHQAQSPDSSAAARYAVVGLTRERLRGNCFGPASALPGQGAPVTGTADLRPSSDADAELQLFGVIFPRGNKAAAARAAASSWRERRRRGGAAAAPLLQIPGLDNSGCKLPGWPVRPWHGLFLPPKSAAPDSPSSGSALRAVLKVPDILSGVEAMLNRQRRELPAQQPGNEQQRRDGTLDARSDDGPDGNEELVLPSGPVHLPGLRPCVDEARGGLGVCTSVDLPPGAAVGVLGGMVLLGQRGGFWDRGKGGLASTCRELSEAEEYTKEGYQWLEDEAAKEELRSRGPGGNVHVAWQYLAMSYQMAYPDELMEAMEGSNGGGGSSGDGGAEAVSPRSTAQPSPHVLCMLGHGNVLALLNDVRNIDLNTAKEDDRQARGNCAVISLSVHGVALPLVVTLCNIRAGSQLYINYGNRWWQQLAGPWEMAVFEDLDIRRILHGDGEDLAEAMQPGPAAAAAATGRCAAAAEVPIAVGATQVSDKPGTTAVGGGVEPAPTAPAPVVAEPTGDRDRQQAAHVSERNSGHRSRSRKRSRSPSGHRDRAKTPTRNAHKRSRSRSCRRDNGRQRSRSHSRPHPSAQETAARRQERGGSKERDFAREVDTGGRRDRDRDRQRGSDRDRERGRERHGGRDVERGPEPQRQPGSPRPAGPSKSGPSVKQTSYTPSACREEAGAGSAPHQHQPPLQTSPKEHAPARMPPAASQAASKPPQATWPATARPPATGPSSTIPPPAASTEVHRRRTRSRSRERPKPPAFLKPSPHTAPSARGQFITSRRGTAPTCPAQPSLRPLPSPRGHNTQPQPEEPLPRELLAVMPVLDGHFDDREIQRCMATLDRPLVDELRSYFAPWLRLLD